MQYLTSTISHPCSTFGVSGDSLSSHRNETGFGIALSLRVKRALLGWILVNSRLCIILLHGSVRVKSNHMKRLCLFVVSAHAAAASSSPECYRELPRLQWGVRLTSAVVTADDLKTQSGCSAETERHMEYPFTIWAYRTDNGDRLIQVRSYHRLFQTNVILG